MEPEFPTPVAEMCAELAGRGFDILEDRHGAADGVMLVLQGPVKVGAEWVEAFVRISADRGRWSVAVRFEDTSRWVWTQSWAAFLDGCEPGEPDLERQVTLVRDRLAEAAAAVRAEPGSEHELNRVAENHLRKRLGLPAV
jgi:hypothetical protein